MSGTDGTGVAETVQQQVRETNLAATVALGVGAFVIGLVVTAALILGVGSRPAGGLSGAALTIGFTYYAAQLVRIDLGDGTQIDFFAGVTDTAIPLEFYYAVPMIVLIAAGVFAAERYSTQSVDPVGTAMQVFGIAVGYLAVALLGTLVLVTPTVTGETASLVTTDVLLYGLVYPLVFGTLGAGIVTARELI